MNKTILNRIKKIEEIVKASSDPDEMTKWLREILPNNRKSFAELLAELDMDTLRAMAESDEADVIFVNAIRELQKGGKL
jgi:hypothetical protein